MFARLHSAALSGVDAREVEIEVNAGPGEVKTVLVGLPDAAVRESIDRVKNALSNSGLHPPAERITVNLAPADLKKEGPSFDLPIALGMIAAAESLPLDSYAACAFIGELALDGKVRPVRGVLSVAQCVRDCGRTQLYLPRANAREAALVEGLAIVPIDNLEQAWRMLIGEIPLEVLEVDRAELLCPAEDPDAPDFSEVKGQQAVKRALEVAAAGGHNLLMLGPPGTGKSMLAQRLPSILPNLEEAEAIEVTRVHSIAGLLDASQGAILRRPFRSPHHTISEPGLLGGGTNPRPGEVSLAHRGVLFLDELPEFKRGTLEVMRQPLEDRKVTVTRAAASLTFPAQFMLIAAMNPCPCGYHGDPHHECRCTPRQIEQYRQRISGPLLDRIDIHCEVPLVPFRDLQSAAPGEPSKAIRARVEAARQRQIQRFKRPGASNAAITPRELRKHCALDSASRQLLESAMERLKLSARAHDRILKLARTIADLDAAESIQSPHLLEAIHYRSLDRRGVSR